MTIEIELMRSLFSSRNLLLANIGCDTSDLFGSTYVRKQLFSKIKVLKTDYRNRLDDERLKNCVEVAVSIVILDIDELVNGKQSLVSH